MSSIGLFLTWTRLRQASVSVCRAAASGPTRADADGGGAAAGLAGCARVVMRRSDRCRPRRCGGR
jgi:hypothetical protein